VGYYPEGTEPILDSKRKILFFTHAERAGAAEDGLLDLMRKLGGERYENSVLFLTHSPAAALFEDAGFQARTLDTPEHIVSASESDFFTRGNVLDSLGRVRDARRFKLDAAEFFEDSGADLIFTCAAKAHIIGGLAGREARKPVIWRAGDCFSNPRARAAVSWLAKSTAGMVICNSKFVAAQFRRHRGIHVVYDGADAEQLRRARAPEAVREELGIPGGAPVIGMTTPPAPGAGHEVFLRAAARILEDIKEARFIVAGLDTPVAGENAFTALLHKLAADYGIQERIIFPGAEMQGRDILNAMDIFVHPSLKPEPFGLDIVEAMLLGKPVVSAATGGPEEIVRHTETGVMIEPSDSVAIARAVVQLIDNPEVARAFGENGLARANELFTREKSTAAIIGLIEKVFK
jgi:glycosyltransferase involved in cell wall biosynthesis